MTDTQQPTRGEVLLDVEDLVKIGYTYPQAHAIGERVCRDEYGQGEHEYMASTLRKIMATTPPGH